MNWLEPNSLMFKTFFVRTAVMFICVRRASLETLWTVAVEFPINLQTRCYRGGLNPIPVFRRTVLFVVME